MVLRPRVIVIGGGVSGTASAYELARHGARVTLLERSHLASMGSGRTLAGVRQSGRHPAELPLAIAAVRRWETLHLELDADVEYRQNGNLRLARDSEDVAAIARLVNEQRALGLEIEFFGDNYRVRSVAPALATDILAASYCPTDGHANPVKTVSGFARAAERHGAQILERTAVNRLLTENGRVSGVESEQGILTADHVILAAGIDTGRLLQPIGIEIPISLGFVPVVQTVSRPPLFEQVLGTAKAHFAARQEVDGKVRFSSGGQPFDLAPDQITVDLMQPSCSQVAEANERAIAILPELEHTPINQVWGGLIDLTPDGIPVIDRVSDIEGLVVAAGFCGHGFCLGPVTGQILRELVLDGRSSYPVDSFGWGRFSANIRATTPQLHG